MVVAQPGTPQYAPSIAAGARRVARASVTRLLGRVLFSPGMRATLNRLYRSLPLERKRVVHRRLAKTFAGAVKPPGFPGAKGDWTVKFVGRGIRLPLRASHLDIDWDNALSILGAETEIKRTYAELLRSRVRPQVFVDAGASYGTHSLLQSVHGLPSVAFEPNPTCHDTFGLLASMNGVAPRLLPVALGDRSGTVELWFPEQATWLGTTCASMEGQQGWVRCDVPVRTLDEFLPSLGPGRVLLKLDVEGAEPAVLRGAARLLEERRPWIILESGRQSNREGLFLQLGSVGYRLAQLPLERERVVPTLDLDAFVASRANNFAAVPADDLRGGTVALEPADRGDGQARSWIS